MPTPNLNANVQVSIAAPTPLSDSSSDLRAMVNALPGVVFQFRGSSEQQYAFSYLSSGFHHLLDVPPARSPREFAEVLAYVEPQDLPALQRSIEIAVATRSEWHHRFRVITPAGEIRWLSGRSSPEHQVGDTAVVFNGLIVDVTDQVRAERALAEAKHANELILNAAGEGIFGVDLNNCVSFMNPAAARLLACAADSIIGCPVQRFKPAEMTVTPPKNDRSSAPTEVNCGLFQRLDGNRFPVEFVQTDILEDNKRVGSVIVFRDMSLTHQLSAELEYQASHDELTGLSNRRDFERRLEQFYEHRKSAPASTAVFAYLDLDQFKLINETCGHAAGDELLRQISQQCKPCLQQGDMLARLGGDEFGFLLFDSPVDSAAGKLEQLLQQLADYRFIWHNRSYRVSASIGLVEINALMQSSSDVFRCADAACYAAKEAGRNRLHIYRRDDSELVRRDDEMQWVARIGEAIENDEFVLFGQRIVPVTNTGGALHHAEILIRMKNAEGGIVSPGMFLPAAERYGLSPLLDRWVIAQTFAWLAGQSASARPDIRLAVNLSGLSLGNSETLAFISDQFAQGIVPAEQICFEITETAAIANLSNATEFIHRLKDYGCEFALDDFGSGLSSFAYLKSLPVDYLKIDGMFVRDLLDDKTHRAMVKSINEIGHVMGIKTIAEYVENSEIVDELKVIGVDFAQGYHLGKPMPLDELFNA